MSSELPRLWIVMPVHDSIHPATTSCLVALTSVWERAGGCVRLLTQAGSLVALQRDQLTRALLERERAGDEDLVLWFDSDMSVDPVELAQWLLRTPHGAVVGVAARKKRVEVEWCGQIEEDQGGRETLPEHLSHCLVGRTGGACLSMRAQTMRRIYEAAPIYQHEGRPHREVWPCGPCDVTDANGETVRMYVGEDIGFGLRARMAGVVTLVDPTVEITHHDGRQRFTGRLADELPQVDGSGTGHV